VYEVRLTVTDADGCSTRRVYTGHTTVCPGGSEPTATATLDTLPAISALSLTKRRFVAGRRPKRGTALRYTLSEAARVTFSIERKVGARRARFKRVGRFVAAGRQGANRTRFSGMLRGRALKAGFYRLTAIATDSAGGPSNRRSASFRIARRAPAR
jgi:hypothetical protein